MTYGLQYSYLRNENNNPVVALAMLTAPNSTKISFQIATCNKKDNFNKSVARTAAGGRLAKHPVTIDMGVNDSKQSDIVVAILRYLIESGFAGVKAGPLTKHIVSLNDMFSK